MPSDFPALSELTRYVPAAGDAIALHLEDGTAERVVVQSATGSHIVVRSVLRAEPGDELALVWRMAEGRARCDARVVAMTGELVDAGERRAVLVDEPEASTRASRASGSSPSPGAWGTPSHLISKAAFVSLGAVTKAGSGLLGRRRECALMAVE